MDEYLGDFLFDTFQPFHFFQNEEVDYVVPPYGRGLHSFTSQLNLSALFEIGGARRGCVALVKGVSGGCVGCAFVPGTAQLELESE